VTLKILLVDDEADIVEVVQDRLEHYGFTVVTAGTGLDALKKLAVEAFDGVFLDIKMPEMDGMEALGEIRKRDTKIPVIILTASSTQDTAIEAMNRGANDYILKPLEWDELKVKIEKLYHLTLR
jgi:DNA-binding response OmpR family regulator